MLDERTIQRFESALADDKLQELSEQFVSEGLSQVAIYDLFESFWEFLGAAKRERDEATLENALEDIVGYCPPSRSWFGHYLTNEEIYAYRRTKAS
jgi:hypothetical protein